ncbi:MAG: GH92 family glycosyl hydrolase [Bacteroidales bacterium]|nr:GH92 family glycosyl hydrolase [Bacteroidales bacterium]
MKFKYLLPILAVVACTTAPKSEESYTSYVNTRIGSGGHGHVFVGANVPFGMVQVGPTSIPQEWDWCSGYHNSDSTVIGFSHTHLEGTGIGDLFDVTLMPVVGEVTYARGKEEKGVQSGLWSYADRTQEVTKPGYYSVPLTRYGIKAEVTATNRVGMHRYTFPAAEDAAIVIDLENGGCWDMAYETGFNYYEGTNSISGWRHSTGWAKNQKVFFSAEFSKDVKNVEIINIQKGPRELPLYARVNFGKVEAGEQILVKVGLSAVDVNGSQDNLDTELPGWDFDATAQAADAAWNKELGKVKVSPEDPEARTIFYTALYHTMIHPGTFCDTDKKYRGADGEVHLADFTNYTIFSLWDTYRAQMPLLNILHPDKADDMAGTMLHIYNEYGQLPVWHLWGCENYCMAGNPGVISLGDAIVKGYKGFDVKAAFEAMKTSVMLDDRGQDLRKKYGFIPSDLYNESVANDMEYAIADGAVANTAAYLAANAATEEERNAYKADEATFRERSHSYRNYMDKETLLARGRLSDGSWRTPFHPLLSNHREQDYMEGNAWQYTWLAPQDFDGLVEFYGSKEKLVERLDTLFAQPSIIEGENASPDISGLIGQYVHGNEPSHHIIYFYSMAGAPAKAADRVREVYETMYFNNDNGLAGNEDEGQMSAWYVLSAMGFYQVEPASTQFWFGMPRFREMEVAVAGGTLSIKCTGKGKYIQSVALNGAAYDKGYIDFADITAGGTLEFTLGDTPVCWY